MSFAARGLRAVSAIKIADLPDRGDLLARLAATRASLPETSLVVDVVWAWSTVSEAIEIASTWQQFGLAWIADPAGKHRLVVGGPCRRVALKPLSG